MRASSRTAATPAPSDATTATVSGIARRADAVVMRANDNGAGVQFRAADGANNIVLRRSFVRRGISVKADLKGVEPPAGGGAKDLKLVIDIAPRRANSFIGGCLARADMPRPQILQAANM